jgi:hypothetical protein
MISNEHKFLFIDIVKTAGTSICQVFEQYGGKGKHHSVCRSLPDLPENRLLESPPCQSIFDEYFCFTFARNPYDRLISLYSYCQTAPLQTRFNKMRWEALRATAHRDLPAKAHTRNNYWPEDFSVFVEWLVDHESYYSDFTGEKYIPMKDWIVDRQGTVKVSFVGKYENLQDDFNFVMKNISGDTQKLPSTNESLERYKLSAAKIIQSSKIIQSMIQTYYKNDFEYFQYPPMFEDTAANEVLQQMR